MGLRLSGIFIARQWAFVEMEAGVHNLVSRALFFLL